MSRIFAGFVKGFSDTALDSLQLREQQEAETKKIKLLDQLRRDTIKYEAELMDSFERRKPSKDLSENDYASGVRINRNEYGEEIGRIPLSESALEDREFAVRTAELDIANVESQISSRNRDDARQERYTNAAIANMDKVDEKGVAMSQYNRTFEDLSSLINPTALARGKERFWDGVNNRGWNKAQQKRFLDEYYRRAVSENNRAPGRKPLTETHPASTKGLFGLDDDIE